MEWGDGYRLTILEYPYRLLIEPMVSLLKRAEKTGAQ